TTWCSTSTREITPPAVQSKVTNSGNCISSSLHWTALWLASAPTRLNHTVVSPKNMGCHSLFWQIPLGSWRVLLASWITELHSALHSSSIGKAEWRVHFSTSDHEDTRSGCSISSGPCSNRIGCWVDNQRLQPLMHTGCATYKMITLI